jgi:hypothetical protein
MKFEVVSAAAVPMILADVIVLARSRNFDSFTTSIVTSDLRVHTLLLWILLPLLNVSAMYHALFLTLTAGWQSRSVISKHEDGPRIPSGHPIITSNH